MLENCKKPDYAHALLMIKFLKILCSQQQRGVDESHLCEGYLKQALGSSSHPLWTHVRVSLVRARCMCVCVHLYICTSLNIACFVDHDLYDQDAKFLDDMNPQVWSWNTVTVHWFILFGRKGGVWNANANRGLYLHTCRGGTAHWTQNMELHTWQAKYGTLLLRQAVELMERLQWWSIYIVMKVFYLLSGSSTHVSLSRVLIDVAHLFLTLKFAEFFLLQDLSL